MQRPCSGREHRELRYRKKGVRNRWQVRGEGSKKALDFGL